ncbi:MAG: RNA 2',3'-cyclic phosphodiesterase [Candidatus Omnitrophica bacterium]|nr:RNA 2',3'-cyclic phosphodiesterase [Candidatus Omnitrophota bacterium]
MAPETVRAFLAVELSESLKQEARIFVDSIRDQSPGFRFIDVANWHLTLHFLGQIPQAKIDTLQERLPDVLKDSRPFPLYLEGAGVFPSAQRPRILWLGVQGGIPELIQIKGKLDQALRKMHFSIENREFQPHVTIARAKDKQSSFHLLPEKCSFKTKTIDQVRQITLFKSELFLKGAQHTPLAAFPFSASANV